MNAEDGDQQIQDADDEGEGGEAKYRDVRAAAPPQAATDQFKDYRT
jgi:hypothetical protein